MSNRREKSPLALALFYQNGGISANSKQTWVAWTNLFVRAKIGI